MLGAAHKQPDQGASMFRDFLEQTLPSLGDEIKRDRDPRMATAFILERMGVKATPEIVDSFPDFQRSVEVYMNFTKPKGISFGSILPITQVSGGLEEALLKPPLESMFSDLMVRTAVRGKIDLSDVREWEEAGPMAAPTPATMQVAKPRRSRFGRPSTTDTETTEEEDDDEEEYVPEEEETVKQRNLRRNRERAEARARRGVSEPSSEEESLE